MGNLLMRRALFAGEADLFPQYVQNGLVFCLDGIKNTPNGHDPNSPYWVDLANPTEGYLYNASAVIASKYCIPNGKMDRQIIASGEGATIIVTSQSNTVEVVFEALGSESQWLIGRGGNYQGNSCFLYDEENEKYTLCLGTRSSGARYVDVQSGVHTYTAPKWQPDIFYIDGVGVTPTVGAYGSSASSSGSIFWYRSTIPRNNISKIYAMRIYSRTLTADEIAQNAEVDRKRFGFSV